MATIINSLNANPYRLDTTKKDLHTMPHHIKLLDHGEYIEMDEDSWWDIGVLPEGYTLIAEQALANENEDYYHGAEFVRVIRRDSDGELFGSFWWDAVSKHGEPEIEDFNFYPVAPFTVIGYAKVDTEK